MFDLAGRRRDDRIPADLLASSRAAALALAAKGPRKLVHGDLHPGNVLAGAGRAVAIDPRPCIGDPAFDAVDWVLHPRHTQLSVFDADRVRAWCEALAVLVAMSRLRTHKPDNYIESLLELAREVPPIR